ncbi:slit homolog 2 protein-like [Pollicipes pollicipes]|uniref:slit homolog 2 protein-like n=1 Tax=Pollicipes pollicipes TaxID=41117 RepID=UPI001885999F|nr:slit homolog 2 protein-like [Pollicipes pollicipes]
MGKLETFDLQSNPLACNCRLRWMTQWLREQLEGDLQVGAHTCELPDRLRRKPLTRLVPADFQCEGADGREQAGCPATNYCPRGCKCVGTVVRCSRAPAGARARRHLQPHHRALP